MPDIRPPASKEFEEDQKESVEKEKTFVMDLGNLFKKDVIKKKKIKVDKQKI